MKTKHKENNDEFKGWLAPSDVCLIIQNRCDDLAETCDQLKDRCITDEHIDTDFLRSHFYKRLFDLNRDITRYLRGL